MKDSEKCCPSNNKVQYVKLNTNSNNPSITQRMRYSQTQSTPCYQRLSYADYLKKFGKEKTGTVTNVPTTNVKSSFI
jgi:hypothetical protein